MTLAPQEIVQAPAREWKSYPEYRDSGVEWLGEIPVQWTVAPIKRNYTVQLGKMLRPEPLTPEDTLEPYLRAANIHWSGVDVSNVKEMWFSPQEKLQYVVKEGDLLVSEGGDVGRSAVWANELPVCYIQNAVNRVRGSGSGLTRYLYYWIFTLKHQGYIDLVCNKATIAHLTAEKLERLPTCVPSLSEQQDIAAFLGRETQKIDDLIAKRKRLIELLEEKRTALISRAVTKGLDPDVPMKDSGVEWLGQVPERWEVLRIATAVQKITNGYVGPTRDILVDDGVPYLQSLHIKEGEIRYSRKPYYVTKEWSIAHLKSVLRKGDVLVVQTGDIGQVAVVPERFEGANCHALIILRLRDGVGTGSYLSALLRSDYGYNALRLVQTGALHPHLECGWVREIKIPLPPPDEQAEIVECLRVETSKIDSLIGKVQEHVEKLREYRTALISAAVTGKIDVREEVPEQLNRKGSQ